MGRCVEIKMLPLSFKEFLNFHNFEIREIPSALGGSRKQVNITNLEKYLTPICASAVCPELQMSD